MFHPNELRVKEKYSPVRDVWEILGQGINKAEVDGLMARNFLEACIEKCDHNVWKPWRSIILGVLPCQMGICRMESPEDVLDQVELIKGEKYVQD